jgi:hypothetical protein
MRLDNKNTIDNVVVVQLKSIRKTLDAIFVDIMSRHDNWNVDCTGADSTPVIFYDEVNSEPYTLDAISYNEENDTFDIEGSSCDNWVEVRLNNMDLDYYAGLVHWLLENEDDAFAGKLSVDNYEDDDE